ncbi:hypothetical protein [Colwellia sp. E2M01]|uniref:hypothetical protein n=1 Tax=Colwellia sp. E2M01 TaxID=2841561 RepID=UPI001C0A46D5|nr:hypothetical protein [Colwellia sp. E2M01]MBU2871551.1 hypothetical protein [Colwellia sp. E2M01]
MKTKLALAISSILAIGGCSDDFEPNTTAGHSVGSVSVEGLPYSGDQNRILTATVSDSDGFTESEVVYSWIRTNADGDTTTIDGATENTYAIAAADIGFAISVKASYTDKGGDAELPVSAPTEVIEAEPAAVVGTVEIDGYPWVGYELAALIDDNNGVSDDASYTWLANNEVITHAEDSEIFTVTDAELAKTITVSVTYTDNLEYSEGPHTSAATAAITPEPAGTEKTKVASITDNDSSGNGQLRYKFSEEDIIVKGKMTLSFSKDDLFNGDTGKEAYLTLFGTSTSNADALVDIRIGNTALKVRDDAGTDGYNDALAEIAQYTTGEWVDVEVTWDATNATEAVLPEVSITINGTEVVGSPFTSLAKTPSVVAGGVQTVNFKVGDSSSVMGRAALRVDDLKLYSGEAIAYEDDFESYADETELADNTDFNASSPEAVVDEIVAIRPAAE